MCLIKDECSVEMNDIIRMGKRTLINKEMVKNNIRNKKKEITLKMKENSNK